MPVFVTDENDHRPNAYEATVDTAIADLYEAAFKAEAMVSRAERDVREAAGQKRVRFTSNYEGSLADAMTLLSGLVEEGDSAVYASGWHTPSSVLDALQAARDNADEAHRAYEEAAVQYAGWSRFFAVMGGHIHSSRRCNTCYPTTRFGWLPALSGLTEADAVDMYGDMLCTICFPSAPVEQTTSMFDGLTRVEREAKRAERAAEKATRDAKKAAKTLDTPITVDRYGWVGNDTPERIETVHAAKMQIKKYIDDSAPNAWRGVQSMDADKVARDTATLVEALEAKGIDIQASIAKWTKAANK